MDKRTKPGQGSLFDDEVGSPLFSKSPMKADDSVFAPKEEAQQDPLFGPPEVGELAQNGRDVHCPFCDNLVRLRFVRLPEHTVDGEVLTGPLFGSAGELCEGSGLKLT